MKKMLLLAAACLLTTASVAYANTQQTLTVNGETVEKTLARVTFDGDNVLLLFDDQTTITADMEAVTLALDYTTPVGICTVRQAVTDRLDLDGLTPGTQVLIYDANGRLVAATTAQQAKVTLATDTMKSGVYLLKAGGQTVKFVKR